MRLRSMTARATLAAIAVAGAVLVLAGCSPLGALNALVSSEGYTVHTAAYGAQPRQQVDVYRPAGVSAPAPVVVFFYGGSWRTGERAQYRFVGQALAARGIVTVVADYRLFPQVRYPEFLHDSAMAVAWTLREIAAFGGDPARVVVMGHSAGAYNAAMLALDARWLNEAGASPRMLAGWIGLAGPYNFLPIVAADVKPVFDFPDTPADSQPIAHVSAQSPPALLLAAPNDTVVNPDRNTGMLAASLRAAGVPVTSHVVGGVGHITLLAAIAQPLHGLAPVLDDVTAFVKSVTTRPERVPR